jgi:hypothetical protein
MRGVAADEELVVLRELHAFAAGSPDHAFPAEFRRGTSESENRDARRDEEDSSGRNQASVNYRMNAEVGKTEMRKPGDASS